MSDKRDPVISAALFSVINGLEMDWFMPGFLVEAKRRAEIRVKQVRHPDYKIYRNFPYTLNSSLASP